MNYTLLVHASAFAALTGACLPNLAHAADAPFVPREAEWTPMDALVFGHASRHGAEGEDTGIVIGALYNGYRLDTARDAENRTPLMVAAATGNEEFVRVALSAQASDIAGGPLDVSAKDNSGWTALEHARHSGHTRIVALLEEGPQPAGSQAAAPTHAVTRPALEPESAGSSGPIGIALWSPLAVGQGKDRDHTGFSLALLYGSHRSLQGAQFGTITHTRRGGTGLQVGAFSWTGGPFYGVQVGGFHFSPIGSRLTADAPRPPGCYGICVGAGNAHGGGAGLHAGVLNIVEDSDLLLQAGVINIGGRRMRGLMLGASNHVRHDFDGLQIGFFNWNNFLYEQSSTDYGYVREVTTRVTTWRGQSHAVQISLWNTADRIDGVQIGAFNQNLRQTRGVQVGAINVGGFTATVDELPSRGVQLGGLNAAGDFKGLQVGLLNIARKLDGAQIGGLNIAWKNKVPVTVVFNAG